mgnify:CR=1 FL=1
MQDAPLDEQALTLVQNAASAVQGMAEERDLVSQLLGQAQMADAFAKFSVTVTSFLALWKSSENAKCLDIETFSELPVAWPRVWEMCRRRHK